MALQGMSLDRLLAVPGSSAEPPSMGELICDMGPFVSLDRLLARSSGPPRGPLGAGEDEVNWERILSSYSRYDRPLSKTHVEQLVLEVDYCLSLTKEAATCVSEAAVLAAERVQDERIAKIIRDAAGDWKSDLTTLAVTVLISGAIAGPAAAWLSTVIFKPGLSRLARGIGQQLSRGRKRSTISDFRRALAVVGDQSKLRKLRGKEARKYVETLTDCLDTAAENFASTSAQAVAEYGTRQLRRDSAEGSMGTHVLAELLKFASETRLLADHTRYVSLREIRTKQVTVERARQILDDSSPPSGRIDLGLSRVHLADTFEAVIWSQSLPKLSDPTPTWDEHLEWRHHPSEPDPDGPIPIPPPMMPLQALGQDEQVCKYLLSRFLPAAEEWFQRGCDDHDNEVLNDVARHSGVDPDKRYLSEYVVVAYLRAMREAGVATNAREALERPRN